MRMKFLAAVIAGGFVNSVSDPYFSDVTALLHFDGVDESTTITDETGGSWTASGNAQIDTAAKKFGTGSLLLDGVGDYITRSYVTNSFDWWVSASTIECWVYAVSWSDWSQNNGTYDVSNLISNVDLSTGSTYWAFGPITGGSIRLYYWNGAQNVVTSTGTLSTSTWHHIAMTTNGTDIKLFINGVLDGSGTISGTPQSDNSIDLCIGAGHNGSTNNYITGRVDDFRFTKGVQRYTTNFSIPTQAFPDS